MPPKPKVPVTQPTTETKKSPVPKKIIPEKPSPVVGEGQWFNTESELFTESPIKWYNLNSKRFVENRPKYSPVYGLREIRVLGDLEHIKTFLKLNKDLTAKRFPGIQMNKSIFEPFENIQYLANEAADRSHLCFEGQAGTVIVGSTQTGQVDIESIPLNTLSSLCKFSFGGLFVKGRIISVIDGDTFDMAFFVPLMTLGTSRVLGEKREPKVSILPSGRYQQSGFIAKVALRTYGYDAAEKDTTEGKVAKKMMEDKFESIKGIVWCQFIESSIAVDKYGRHLAVVYEDEKRTKIATDYLLEQEKKTRIKMVHPYSGGTKQKF